MRLEAEDVWYDENGDLIVLTTDSKVIKVTNPVVTGAKAENKNGIKGEKKMGKS